MIDQGSRKAPTKSQINYSDMPEEMKSQIFDIYIRLVKYDMEKLKDLNKSIPSKNNMAQLMDKLIAVYNNIEVCKENAKRMGTSETNSLDDFLNHMREIYFFTSNNPLHFMHTLGSGFEDIVVTYFKPKSRMTIMVRIHVNANDMASDNHELERTVTLIKSDKTRQNMKKKILYNDVYNENARDIFENMSNLQMIKRIHHLLYIDVPSELGLGQFFYVQSIYSSCTIPYEQMNRWEYEHDESCTIHTELGHLNLQKDPEEDFTTKPLFVYGA